MANGNKTRIAVVDGQGGGLGKALVEKFRQAFGDRVFLLALGTNSMAASAMLRAGADAAATGENAIVVNARDADYIAGAIGILTADSMLGEISPSIACAIGKSRAQKILIPINRCNVSVAGIRDASFSELVEDAVRLLKTSMAE